MKKYLLALAVICVLGFGCARTPLSVTLDVPKQLTFVFIPTIAYYDSNWIVFLDDRITSDMLFAASWSADQTSWSGISPADMVIFDGELDIYDPLRTLLGYYVKLDFTWIQTETIPTD